jgi:Xaa-Pro aminopeptidase
MTETNNGFAPSDNSEYIADTDARRAYISSFTGSAGRALITPSSALLWTDGRYFLQASKQLDPAHWTLMKAGEKDVPTMTAWLIEHYGFDEVTRVGIDPRVVTYEMAKALRDALKEKEGKRESKRELVAVQENLVDEIWTGDKTSDGKGGKPARPTSEVFILDEKYTGTLPLPLPLLLHFHLIPL